MWRDVRVKKISRKWMKGSLVGMLVVGAAVVWANTNQIHQTKELASQETKTNQGAYQRVSVHDPSIVKADGKYYVFGSHIAVGKSEDLMNWKSIGNAYTTSGNAIYGDLSSNLKQSFAWAGENDSDCLGGYAVWAPDVFWNAAYENEDGSKGAYMIYYCTSSTYKRSCIGYAVSDKIEGPYHYVNTVVYSGFTKEEAYDTNSKVNTQYLNTNLKTLIADKMLQDVNPNWFTADGAYNTDYAPNAIDPNLFYDAEGTLWMAYGSWSGGIYVLPIDQKTGLPIYPGEDGKTENGNRIDRYFGTQIAGGHTMSGEGPYIVYDQNNGYYYLFMSYAGLAADGGYNMRLFRSEKPDGPYLDAEGNNASLAGKVDNNAYGIKLMGNYQWNCLDVGYKSCGHNSAFIDEDGQFYLVYHTRFNGGTELHEVRVHQMFMNEDNWPVVAPYEYSGSQMSPEGYALDEVIGKYEWINHQTDSSADMLSTQMISLNEDYTVSGAVEGTWQMSKNRMTITIDGVTYKGVFFKQLDESKERKEVMTFSVVGENNTCIWGSQLKLSDEEMINCDVKCLKSTIKQETKINLNLPVKGQYGSEITWKSSNPAIISDQGIVKRAKDSETVTLTAQIKYGQAILSQTFDVKVMGLGEELTPLKKEAKYLFDADYSTSKGLLNSGKQEALAKLVGNAMIQEDLQHGKVVQILSGANETKKNYIALPQDTFAQIDEGYTVAMWVKVDTSDANYWEHSALFEANGGGQDQYPVTRISANLYGRINANGKWGDVTSLEGSLQDDTWHYVAYTVNYTGIVVCLDGQEIGNIRASLEECFQDQFLAGMTDVRVGSGNIWGDADIAHASFDRIAFYDTPLSVAELIALYKQEVQ